MDKQNVVHLQNEIFFNHKRKKVLLHATVWMNPEYIIC